MRKKHRFIPLRALLPGCLLLATLLAGCGCDDGGEIVFVQTGEREVSSVGVAGPGGSQAAQKADGTPLTPGESYSFEAAGWPAEVTAYREADGRGPRAAVTLPEAPPEGERWFVYFRHGTLAYGTEWPLED